MPGIPGPARNLSSLIVMWLLPLSLSVSFSLSFSHVFNLSLFLSIVLCDWTRGAIDVLR